MIGETLGKYQIVEHLGHGGMAEVYKAYQPALDRYVAVKVLHSFLADEENFLARFQREAKAVAALRHPNIIQVYDFDHDLDRHVYYMVMEYIDGPSLKVRLQELAAREERMPLDEAVRIAVAVGEALDYAHRRGMVHRDIKPANIMFNREGEVILTDFGIAKIVNVTGLTASGAMVGTPAYISPEQGLGQAGDERSDIYSLGVVLYQMVTGSLPFDADTPMGVVLKHINEPLPSPRALRPDLPMGLEHALLYALAKDPAQRYATAAQFVADLGRVGAGQEIRPFTPGETTAPTPMLEQTIPMRPVSIPEAPTPPPWSTPVPAPPPRRHRFWIPLVVILAVFLLMVAGVVAYGERLSEWLVGVRSAGEGTITPNLDATQIAATVAALQATIGAPTAPPTVTPTSPPDLTATAMAACVFEMELVDDVPVSPAALTPGRAFTKRWVVRNSGTCGWRDDFRLVFVSGEQMGGPERVEAEPLAVGEEWEIEFGLAAPAAYGTYRGIWELQDEQGRRVGERLEVEVRVSPPPAVPSPTPKPVPTPTPTPTPARPLEMSYPVLVSCSIIPDIGQWGGRVAWTAWPEGRAYRYYWGAITPAQELEGPYHDFTAQVGRTHQLSYFTTSGGPFPETCCPGPEGYYRGEDGSEVVWRTVIYAQSDCP